MLSITKNFPLNALCKSFHNAFTMQDIFVFQQEGVNADGKVIGHFAATGNIPYFVEVLRQRGRLKLDMAMFSKNNKIPVGGK